MERETMDINPKDQAGLSKPTKGKQPQSKVDASKTPIKGDKANK